MFKIEILKYQNFILYPVENITQIPYYELIKVEAVVKIFIDNILFFADDYFPILEFIYQFECWKNEKFDVEFQYNTIESEDNPIISMQVLDGNCTFDSIWKLNNLPLSAKLSDVLCEISRCEKILLSQINQK